MTFEKINRRTHLYLATFLLPWFFMYGVSSILFSHHNWKLYEDGVPDWSQVFEREYHRAIPAGADSREIGAQILRDSGLEWKKSWGAYSPNEREVVVYMYDFWSSMRLTYFTKQDRLLAEKKRFRWDHFLTGLHARGEFEQDLFLADAWAVVVDIVMAAILLWITTGFIMFWQLPQARFWGLLALGSGLVSMVSFLLAL